MRIGLDISCVTPKRTGVGQVAWELTKRMIENENHEYVLFFNSFRQPFPDMSCLQRKNVTICHRHILGPLLLYSWKHFNSPSIEFLMRKRVDAFISFSGYVSPQRFGKRIVFVHDLEYLEGEDKCQPVLGGRYLKWTFWHRLPMVDGIIVNSEQTARYLSEHLLEKKTFVVPLGVGTQFVPDFQDERLATIRRKYQLPENYVLYVGNRHKRKKLSLLFDAISLLKDFIDTDIHLVMAGPKEQWSSEKERFAAEKLLAQGLLHEIDYVCHEDLPVVYACARAFCLTSTIEGFGLPVLEALACGVPVACTDTIAALDYLGASHDAVETFDKQADSGTVANAIVKAFAKKGIASANADIVRNSNNWKKSAARLVTAIEKIAKTLPILIFCLFLCSMIVTANVNAESFEAKTSVSENNKSLTVYLPFQSGRAFDCMQGAHGKFSHNDKWNQYAVDFKMDEGTPICAVARGRVILVESSYEEGGMNTELKSKANRIVIDHGDNVFSKYLHMAPESAKVKMGDMVKAGQVIASSGNTGYSSAPHLHFQMQTMMGQSLPVKFANIQGKPPSVLKEGEKYCADEHKHGAELTYKDSTLLPDLFGKSDVIIDEKCKVTLFDFAQNKSFSISGRAAKSGIWKQAVLVICSLDGKTNYLQVMAPLKEKGDFQIDITAEMLEKVQEYRVGLLGIAVIDKNGHYNCRETIRIGL